MNGIRTRKRTATVVVIVVVIAVIVAVVSLQPHDPGLVVVNNSKSVPFTWTLRSNGTAHITGSITSYFQVPNNNTTGSTLGFDAEFVPLPNPGANNVLLFDFYTNITGNISSALHPDYITYTLNDYGNNTNYVQYGDIEYSFWIPTKADNISPINNGLSTDFGNIGSLSYSAKLLRVPATGHSVYHFHFNGMTLISLSYSSIADKTTLNTFHLYAQLKGLSKVVTCELTFVITTIA